MSKVLNITRHAIRNYGSVLQTYATQELLRRAFGSVETIDYRQPGIDDTARSYREPAPGVAGAAKQLAYRIFRARDARQRGKIFEKFLEEHIDLSPKRYIGYSELSEARFEADDFFCVGSDQVWNIDYNKDNRPYYLSFAPRSAVKFSLSSSIGLEGLQRHEESSFREALSSLDHVSVREAGAVDYLKSLGIEAKQHVDPVLALDPELWRNFASSVPVQSEPYILVYQLNENKGLQAASLALSRKLQVPVLRAEYWRTFRGRGANTILRPTVQELLALFRDAAFVVTDSFHGTALSVVFQKPFSSFVPKKYGSRITSILEHLRIDERRASSTADVLSLLDSPLAFNDIDATLNRDRALVASYLSGIANS